MKIETKKCPKCGSELEKNRKIEEFYCKNKKCSLHNGFVVGNNGMIIEI